MLRYFPKVRGGEVPEEQTSEIHELYKRYERDILWKANNLEDKRHDVACIPTHGALWCKCRTRQEEIHEWEDWLIDNYDKDEKDRDWRIPIKTLARVSPPQPASTRKHHSES